MIPLTLITGFLGSGKTTLLRRIIEANRGRKLAYLVNEFSALDVDARRLADTGGNITCLPGGSIFCQCLVTSFINQLRDIAELHDRPDAPLKGLVIEASGISDPRAVGRMLEETGLDAAYGLARVMCMIDPGTFPKLLATLPNVSAQVAAADLAIINKTDLYDETTIEQTAEAVLAIQPTIRIVLARYAAVDVEPATIRPDVTGGYAPCRDTHYDTLIHTSDRAVDLNRLVTESIALLDGAYRLKGFVWTGRNVHAVDWSPSSQLAVDLVPGQQRRTELTAIFPPHMRGRMELLFSRLDALPPP